MKNILTKGHFGPDFPLKAMDGFDVKDAFSAVSESNTGSSQVYRETLHTLDKFTKSLWRLMGCKLRDCKDKCSLRIMRPEKRLAHDQIQFVWGVYEMGSFLGK